MSTARPRPPAWAALEQALLAREPVRVRYHGHERVICPHALGWKAGRAKVLSYQKEGTTSEGALPADPRQRWRSMSVDEVEGPEAVNGCWETAPNASTSSSCIDELAVAVDLPARLRPIGQ